MFTKDAEKFSILKKFAAAGIAIVLVFSCSISSFADELSDKRDKQEEIANQISSISESISEKKDAMEKAASQLAQIEYERETRLTERDKMVLELNSLKKDLEALDSEIAKMEKEYNEKESLFVSRAKIMYQYSEYSLLDIFFLSDNIFDFLERANTYKKMLSADKALMDELLSMKKQLEYKKTIQESTTANKKELISQIDKAIAAINANEELVFDDYDLLLSTMDELESKEADLISQNNNLSEEIDILEYEKNREKYEDPEEENENNYSYSAGKTGEQVVSGQGYMFPLESYVYLSSPYGYRTHPITGQVNSFHTGIDLAAYCGTPIYAAADGRVEVATSDGGGYGKYVEILHDDGSRTRYAHCSVLCCSYGNYVKRGQKIAEVGMTGSATGYHLHFEIFINDERVNPINYITLP